MDAIQQQFVQLLEETTILLFLHYNLINSSCITRYL